MAHRAALLAHLARIAAPAAAMIVWPAAAPVLAIAAYVPVFLLAHELAHGALGLSRRRNELALALAGVAMATSGHALRRMHLHHHAHPFRADDLEGRSAAMPPWRALVSAPGLAIQLAVAAWRTATARDRRWQRGELATLAALATVIAIAGPHAARCYLGVAAIGQLLAPFWVGHLIHRPPGWLLAIARVLARAGSMTMRTLVLHQAHHRQPKLPTQLLRDAAGPEAPTERSRSDAGGTLVEGHDLVSQRRSSVCRAREATIAGRVGRCAHPQVDRRLAQANTDRTGVPRYPPLYFRAVLRQQ